MLPPVQILLSTVIALTTSILYLGFGGKTVISVSLPDNAVGTALITALISGGLSLLWLSRKTSALSSERQTSRPEGKASTLTPLSVTADNGSRPLQSAHAQAYLDQAHSLVIVINPNGEVQYLNQHGYRFLGYPQESLQGRTG
jgi:PAS domain-containing protein